MRSRRISIVMVPAVLAVSIIALTPTASAENPPSSFFPDENGTQLSVASVVSDLADGTDETARLTVVARNDTTIVHWYACPLAVNEVITQAQLATCEEIGSDATPGKSVPSSADEAYAFDYDVPAGRDGERIDLVALACKGDGVDVQGGDANCDASVESEITLDDAATNGGSTAGAIASYCTDDRDGNGPTGSGVATADPCNASSLVSSDLLASRFHPIEHGDSVPSNGFVLRATTSPDIDAPGQLYASRQFDVGATRDPGDPNQTVPCLILDSSAARTEWECSFPNMVGDDDGQQAVWIWNTAQLEEGAGFCRGAACTLDAIMVNATSARGPATAVLTFQPNPPSPPAGVSCLNPDREEVEHLGNTENAMGCIYDQFGAPIQGVRVTFASSGVGQFTTCPGGSLHDHTAQQTGVNHCHAFTDASGAVAGVTVANATAHAGDQTILFCYDPENGEPEPGQFPQPGPLPEGHGCPDASVKDTATMTWPSLPEHIHAVIDGTGDPSDPCHTGDTNIEVASGETVDVRVCAFDNTSEHRPATTDQLDGGKLLWRTAAVGGGEVPATQVRLPAPEETNDDGIAIGTILATRIGNDMITIHLCEDGGNCTRVPTSTVQIRVTAGGGGTACNDGADNDGDGDFDYPADPGCTRQEDESEAPGYQITSSVSLARASGGFAGRVRSNESPCLVARKVTVKKMRPGRDLKIGSDTTTDSGRWRIRNSAAAGNYRAILRGSTFTQPDNTVFDCSAARSPKLPL